MSPAPASPGLQYNIDKAAAEAAAMREKFAAVVIRADTATPVKDGKIMFTEVDGKASAQKLVRADVADHPLFAIFEAAILQAMYGKGTRHGGNVTPFLDQPWVHYAKLHGRGFLTGQASKKLEEAASTRTGESFETEVFGSMVYAGMSVLKDRGEV